MNYLITGSNGFMGKNLIPFLKSKGDMVFEYDIDSDEKELFENLKRTDCIIHLAGVMRPNDKNDFYDVGNNLTVKIVAFLKNHNLNPLIIFASSIQAELDNDYGISKRMVEDYLIKNYYDDSHPVKIFRFTNSFGKWGKPNYNSVLSTFCYNISHNREIFIRDPNFVVNFIYIDNIIETLYRCSKKDDSTLFQKVEPVFPVSLGELARILHCYFNSLKSSILPRITDEFGLYLFKTFLTYFEPKQLFFKKLISPKTIFYKEKCYSYSEHNIQICDISTESSVALINTDLNVKYIEINFVGFVIIPPGFILESNDIGKMDFYYL